MRLHMILLRSIKMVYLKNKKIDKFIEKHYHFGKMLNEKHYQ